MLLGFRGCNLNTESQGWISVYAIANLTGWALLLLSDSNVLAFFAAGSTARTLLSVTASTFVVVILTSMFIQFRGFNRTWLAPMRLNVSLVGVCAPLFSLMLAGLWGFIHLPALTQTSPNLASQLLTSAISAELLVRFCTVKNVSSSTNSELRRPIE